MLVLVGAGNPLRMWSGFPSPGEQQIWPGPAAYSGLVASGDYVMFEGGTGYRYASVMFAPVEPAFAARRSPPRAVEPGVATPPPPTTPYAASSGASTATLHGRLVDGA